MKFTKMQGCGNDYIFVDGETERIPKERRGELARRISDRHFGVGSDGLIFILPGSRAPFEMEMYNSDGSRAQMCGNGIRCVAKYVCDRGKINRKKFQIESAGSVREVEILERRFDQERETGGRICGNGFLSPRTDGVDMVRVNMGSPDFLPDQVIFSKKLFCVSMGNPHAVLLLQEDSWTVDTEGPLLEKAPCFPERTNVEFVRVESRESIRMRVWERGTGETLACGSGACAAAAVCIQKGLTDEEITVKLLGGELQVAWDREENNLFLTGPAVTVYEGEYPVC